MKYFTTLLLSIFLLIPVILEAQRSSTSYESLLQRSDQPNSYISDVLMPAGDGLTIGVMFRLDYDLAPFLRVQSSMNEAPEGAEYFAPVRIGLEVFEGRHRSGRRASNDARSLFRDSYSDSVYVNSFQETRSRLQHVQGVISTPLDPGSYNYELQLTRAQSTQEQSSTRRNIQVPELDTLSTAGMMLLSNFNREDAHVNGTFLNYGENVLYGSDYNLLVLLPATSENETYTVEVHRMTGAESDRVEPNTVYEATINPEDQFTGSNAIFTNNDSGVGFRMETASGNTRFGVITVPNSEFENARFRIRLLGSSNETIGEKIVNSRWLDMPVSLLNIDVAIDMMKYIVSEDELNRLKRGSAEEKEQKFREFWEERDPTPDTEFNELMTEYYERVDYSFRNFSSLQTPGYNSDMGKAYILYGEPDDVERRLPTDQPTREIWEYPNRTLVFEATSGFGDFRLITEQ